MIPLASDLLVRFRWQMRREGLLASASSPTGFRLSVAVGVSTLTFRESRGDGGSVQKSLLPWQTSHRADMLPRLDCASSFKNDVRFWHIADISRLSSKARFWGQSGHWLEMPRCLLLTQGGHGRFRIVASQIGR